MVKTYRPVSLSKALDIRTSEPTIIFAGGTDLMVRYRTWSGVVPGFPKTLVFIGHLPELQTISIANNTLKIGAACTLAQILHDQRIPEYIKLPLAQMASPSIRNIATIGGNIGNSSPAGDTLPMLYALDAQLTIQAKNKTRVVGIADFIIGPGQNMLKNDEIVSEISIPLNEYRQCYYKKVGSRKANCISKATFYALFKGDADNIHEIKMSFGAVAPTVIRSPEGEALLTGIARAQIPDLLPAVKACYADLIRPIDDLRSTREYRRKVTLRILENLLVRELI